MKQQVKAIYHKHQEPIDKARKIAFRMILLTMSAVLTAVNTKTFISAGNLFPGGVGGITLLIQRIAATYFNTAIGYTPINILLNAIPVYIGFRYLGKKFTAYSCYTIVLAAVITDMIPAYVITYDVLLISIFGGVIGGFASVLCLWVDATAGGMDFISIFLSLRKGMDAWNLILGFNVVILMLAGVLFGWDQALYSMIFQYAFTQVITTLYHKYQQQTLFILTEKPQEVCQAIYEISRHGATILNGVGSYELVERNMVYSIVSRGEVKQIMNEMRRIDPNAFVNSIRTQEIQGYFYQKPTE
ncbi:YitT family protein [Eubacterium aggregans]|uniref:YitT family protein n=1 Tax=Eubacterium aggregans TaxID=81409 RepID=UPI0030B82013